MYFWRTRTGQELDLWFESGGIITAAEVKLSERSDSGIFRALDFIDPSPLRFGRKLQLSISRNLIQYSPGAWNVPVHYIN